jgi:hypothetical protein
MARGQGWCFGLRARDRWDNLVRSSSGARTTGIGTTEEMAVMLRAAVAHQVGLEIDDGRQGLGVGRPRRREQNTAPCGLASFGQCGWSPKLCSALSSVIRSSPALGGSPSQQDAQPPRRRMVGTGSIARQSEPADGMGADVRAKAAAETDRAADPLAEHRIVWRAGLLDIAVVGGAGVEGVAERRAEQRIGRSTWLHRSAEPARREWCGVETQPVDRERPGGRDLAAQQLLSIPVLAGEGDSTYHTATIHHDRPMVVVEGAGVLGVGLF